MNTINKNDPMPLWQQIKESIHSDIVEGVYKQGIALPSEKQFCEKYDVSTITVKKAIKELVKEQMLIRIQGKGTYINRPKFIRKLDTFYGFSQDLIKQGLKPSRNVISYDVITPGEVIASRLNIDTREKIYRIRTLTLADGKPIITTQFFIPLSVISNLTRKEMIKTSIYNLLQEKTGVILKFEKWEIEAVIVSKYEAKLLNISENSAGLLHEATLYDINDNIIMFSKGLIKADSCRLSIMIYDQKSREISTIQHFK